MGRSFRRGSLLSSRVRTRLRFDGRLVDSASISCHDLLDRGLDILDDESPDFSHMWVQVFATCGSQLCSKQPYNESGAEAYAETMHTEVMIDDRWWPASPPVAGPAAPRAQQSAPNNAASLGTLGEAWVHGLWALEFWRKLVNELCGFVLLSCTWASASGESSVYCA